MKACQIEFEPLGRRGRCSADQSVLACARDLGVGIACICGGQGTCKSCKVQVIKGIASQPTSSELEFFSAKELGSGWRLACQTFVSNDCILNVPAESMTMPQRTQVEALDKTVQPQPAIKSYKIKLPVPSLADSRADADRLLMSLNKGHNLHCTRIDFAVLNKLSPQLRSKNWICQAAIRGDEVVGILPVKSSLLGLAIDLGTTKIAGYLVDLKNGRVLASKGVMNPQISYGEDLISRIAGIMQSPEQSKQLQNMVVEAINRIATDLCAQAGTHIEEIVDMVVVGNTAMHHLFLGLPVTQLAQSPFIPAISNALNIKAREIGLTIDPGSYLHLLPNIAGFVGSDHVAFLLATEIKKSKRVVIALDVGTNTEVSLVYDGKVTSVSCASGSAFEGGHIRDGMRAASGAIERLRIEKETVKYQTIDDTPAIGICGSGILDAVAQLYQAGIIDEGGRMANNRHGICGNEKQTEYVLVEGNKKDGHPPVIITQQDVREVQLAKAAIRTGIQVLLETAGCTENQIYKVFIAGAFGTYIDIFSAISIGMLPSLPLDRFCQVGNAAGLGARLALISLRKRARAEHIASKVKYIELASASNFNKTFIQANYLGRYRMINGERRKIDGNQDLQHNQ